MAFLLGYSLKIFIEWGEIDFWLGESTGGIFPGGGGARGKISKFLAGGGTFPYPHSRENPDGWFWRDSWGVLGLDK